MDIDIDLWQVVDDYFAELLLPPDPILDATLRESQTAGLPPISIAPNVGMLLRLLAQMRGAQSILEVGTLGGYSTIWLARALPPTGRLISLEAKPEHARVARANLTRAGLSSPVDIRVGDALDTLPQLQAEGAGPFDFIFIDADKPGYPAYLEWSLALSGPGTVIVADNVVRRGAVVDAENQDAAIQGIRRFLAMLAANPRVAATALQTVGSKGYDGLAIAVVQDYAEETPAKD